MCCDVTHAIEVTDLMWRYSPETDWVLRGVDLQVESGETVAIVGPTGSGKTTLLSFIQSLLPHAFPQGEMRGSVTVLGEDTRKVRAAKLTGKVGMVFEDPEAQFVFPTVEDDLVFALESLDLTREEAESRLSRVSKEFGLEGLMQRTAGELSGGEKQRVSIAGMLAVQPKVLLLDEPTAELDPAGKQAVIEMIKRVRSETSMTIVFVEQDLEEIVGFVDRILLLDDGRIQRASEPSEFLADAKLLLQHGVHPTEISLIFEPLVKTGLVSRMPLTVPEAIKIVGG